MDSEVASKQASTFRELEEAMIRTDEDETRFHMWLEKKRLQESSPTHRVSCPKRRRDDVPVLEESCSEELNSEYHVCTHDRLIKTFS
jgi:hypothetical protein